jgi:hypothetical protein
MGVLLDEDGVAKLPLARRRIGVLVQFEGGRTSCA